MRKVFLIGILLSVSSLFAGKVAYQAIIPAEDGQQEVRVVAIFDTVTGALKLQPASSDHHSLQMGLVASSGKKSPVFGSAEIGSMSSLNLGAATYRDLVMGKLKIQVSTGRSTRAAALTRISSGTVYDVTVRNLTRGQTFSPPVALSYRKGFEPVKPGQTATEGLIDLAEEGDGTRLMAEALGSGYGLYAIGANAPVGPGEAVTLEVVTDGRYNLLAVMGMLVLTNDGFFSATDIKVPSFPYSKSANSTRVMAYAFDAGSEGNDENCANMPGCGGAGSRFAEDAEGFVSIHAGIHGGGDLAPSDTDWRGPVALITVTRGEREATTLLRGITVVDGTGSDPIPDANVLIEGNRIVEISTGTLEVPEGSQVIDGTGRFVVPGFIDMHTHYWETGAPDTSPSLADFRHVLPWDKHINWINERALYTFSRFLCGGITTMVEMSSPYYAFELREQARQLAYTPRIRLAGRFLGNTDFGFHYWTQEDPAVVKTYDPETGRQWVAEAIDLGADHIKIGFIPSEPEELARFLPVFDAMLAETHMRGRKLAIHVTELEPAKEFIRRGADILAHPLWESPPDDEFIELAKQHDVAITSSLYLFRAHANIWSREPEITEQEQACGDQQIIDSWKWLDEIPADQLPAEPPWLKVGPEFTENGLLTINKAYEAGVPIVVGSDAGNVGLLAGPSIYREFEMMAEAGMPSEAILTAAAWNAAVSLGIDDELGAVRTGYLADLLILSADPYERWENLTSIDYIISDGVVIPHETLQSLTDDTPPVGPVSGKNKAHSILEHVQRVSKPFCH